MSRRFRALLTILMAVSFSVTLGAQKFQEGPPTKPVVAKAERTPVKTVKVELPPITQIQNSDTPVLRGQNQFIQKCSMCHSELWDRKRAEPALLTLNGVLKDSTRETTVRDQIRRGSARMPGFQHTFTAAELDDLIAYLKTL